MGNLFCRKSFADSENIPAEASKYLATNVGAHDAQQGEVWRVALGAGCYWGTEKFIGHVFPQRSDNPLGGIVSGSGKVGFKGPSSAPANPTYEDVCTGRTGHVEVYDFEFTGGADYFEAILKFFFMIHDPTTLNRQGNDKGTQYASVVYCYNQEEFNIATRIKEEVQQLLNTKALPSQAYSSVRVSTDIRLAQEASPFFAAHKEHQDYLAKNPNGYCNHGFKFKSWPSSAAPQ